MAETDRAAFRIHPDDNTAVTLRPLEPGERISVDGSGITVADVIPPGHKIALRDIQLGERIIKYGAVIGEASAGIQQGGHVHTHNIRTLLSEHTEFCWENFPRGSPHSPPPAVPPPEIPVFRRPGGGTGIRNEIWIIPTVGCVNAAAETLARWGDREFSGGVIDGVYAWPHPYGCSQLGDDHEATQAILANLAEHPNAGAVLIVALGCENNTLAAFKEKLRPDDRDRIAFLTAQDWEDEIAEGKKLLVRLAAHAGKAQRERGSAAELVIGLKCGGSDGFSGITANALAGRVCDAFTGMGASALLSEIPEMFGAENMLLRRCENQEVFEKALAVIDGFKNYYHSHDQPVYENPSPGNKAGGISTLEDKSCGCVQKGGTAPIRGVYRYGERVPPNGQRGLAIIEGPGNDIVSTTAMAAAGAQLILFTTGRGTPLGSPVPVIKIASNAALAQKKKNWIDFDASPMLVEEPEAVCAGLVSLILDVVRGARTCNERNGCREIALFKNGVTL